MTRFVDSPELEQKELANDSKFSHSISSTGGILS